LTNITLFTLETAQELYNTSEAFPIDFDMAWQVLGYSKKSNAKRMLSGYFDLKFDYIVQDFQESIDTIQDGVLLTTEENSNGGRPTEKISLTVDCFKELGMLAKTAKGKEIRQYFLQCERVVKEDHQKLLDLKALDEKKLEFLKLSEKIARKMDDRSGLAVTRWQIQDHLEATRPEMKHKRYIETAKPIYPVPDAIKAKIFEDLLKACKNSETSASNLRTHSLVRRRDVLSLYGSRGQEYLRKAEILKLFVDASKHGYGKFDRVELLFNPVLMTSTALVKAKTS
jgi:phage anti-repressor protein